MISKESIDQIFDAARVEEVIGDFVKLKKSGANFKGLSPFSNEKTPSFIVSPIKQIWKDFSTGKGGNSVSFLMEHEHFSYREALTYLAKKYNIEIQETEQTFDQKNNSDLRERLFLILEYAQKYFEQQLFKTSSGRAIAFSYFKERGYTLETIKKFHLGYCQEKRDEFTKNAIKQGYEIDDIEKTGLTIVKEDKSYDRFKGRVIFPIQSMSGRVLGFGGRTLYNDKKSAKYINSPESEIYHKSKVLYGLYQARKAIVKEDSCFLVEGYTDVITLNQSGVENVVSSLGTAITVEQIRLINRLTHKITILFDSDDAGFRASLRGINLILEQGMSVKVLRFPNGADPDSYAKSVSPIELKNYIKNQAQDFITFKVSLLSEKVNNDPVRRAHMIRDVVDSISVIPDSIQQEVYVQNCSKILNISEVVLFNELAQSLNKKEKQASKKLTKRIFNVIKKPQDSDILETQLYKYEKEIIKILLQHSNKSVVFTDWYEELDKKSGKKVLKKENYENTVINEIYLQLQEDEIELAHPVFKNIFSMFSKYVEDQKPVVIDHFTKIDNPEILKEITHIFMDQEKHILSDNWENRGVFIKEINISSWVTQTILNLRRSLIDLKIKTLMREFSKESTEEKVRFLEHINNYTSLRKILFEKLNRVV